MRNTLRIILCQRLVNVLGATTGAHGYRKEIQLSSATVVLHLARDTIAIQIQKHVQRCNPWRGSAMLVVALEMAKSVLQRRDPMEIELV